MERIEAIVHGIVQGVGYRFYVVSEARDLGINGYACNLPDGSVEVVGEADRAALEKFVSALEKGSPLSRVKKVNVSWAKATREFGAFSLRR